MKTTDRKAAIERYKSRPIQHGISVIRCAISGEAWIAPTTKAGTGKNAVWFQLRLGGSHNRKMQVAWNAHGEQSFSYEIVETFDESLSPHELEVAIGERMPHWTQKFNAAPFI